MSKPTVLLYCFVFTHATTMAVYRDKKHKTYFCKFRYTDWNKQSKMTTKRGFATRNEALMYEVNFKAAADATQNKNKLITVAQLIADKKERDKKKLRESTCIKYNYMYSFVESSLGEMKVFDITPAIIRRWQDQLPDHLSDSTIADINTGFSVLLNYACHYFGLPLNPFNTAGKTGKHTTRRKIIEHSDFLKFIDTVEDKTYHLLWQMLYYSGARIGEIRGLNESDVDYSTNVITINKAFNAAVNKITPPKNESSVRSVVMPDFVIKELREYRQAQYKPQDRIFTMAYSTIYEHLHDNLAAAGLKGFSPHALRHSHASYLIQKFPVTAISSRLGHKNSITTLKSYAHAYQNSDIEIASFLEKNSENEGDVGQDVGQE